VRLARGRWRGPPGGRQTPRECRDGSSLPFCLTTSVLSLYPMAAAAADHHFAGVLNAREVRLHCPDRSVSVHLWPERAPPVCGGRFAGVSRRTRLSRTGVGAAEGPGPIGSSVQSPMQTGNLVS
jgi:hypothetical protein